MNDDERQTRSKLMELFSRQGLNPRTDLGQNFLIDLNLIEFVVAEAGLGPKDVVLEIGAGTGGMTTFLAQQAGDVVSVEIDPNMHRLATEKVAPYPNVTLLNTDALKTKNTFAPEVLAAVDEKLSARADRRLKLVANLPYSVATPVVANLVATELPWERMVVTIQLELAQRMAARPGTADYSALSVWLQAQCRIKILKSLGPTVFWPRPKVHSAIVKILPDPAARASIADRPFFLDFARRLFHHRRKFLRSVLVGMYRHELEKSQVDGVLRESGLNEQARAEALDPPTLVALANRVHTLLQEEGRTTEDTESTEEAKDF